VTVVLHGLDAAQRARVAALRAQGRFFWLDVALSETSRDALVEALGISPGALRDRSESGSANAARTFHADGEAVAFTVRCYVGSEPLADEAGFRLRPLETRVVVTHDYLLTLHEERISLPAALAPDLAEERSRPHAVYEMLAAVLESTFDALDGVELTLERLAGTWDEGGGVKGGGVPRRVVRVAGARLANMRRWVTAEQGVLARLGGEVGAIPGFDTADRYFDRLAELVDRLPASIDAAADAMGMLLDLQLNERAYVVSVVATIFVPLTFVTGFFGMNFGWMVDHIDSPIAFWLLGMGIPIVAAAVSWRFLLRRFLMGDDPVRQRAADPRDDKGRGRRRGVHGRRL
jgi:magnesium transporter